MVFVLHRSLGIGAGQSVRLAASLGVMLAGPACAPATTRPAIAAPATAAGVVPPAAQPCAQPLPPAPFEPCKGQLSPPPEGFAPIEAPELVALAQRGPGLGGVCDARAFEVVKGAPAIYRAYNGTNPRSRLGEWWALEEPSGAVSAYRENYQICYQWSPLDRLVKCTLRAGAKVVLGTGQSVVCSEHLRYSTSASVQLYIANAEANVLDCMEFDAMLSWQPVETGSPHAASPPAEALSVRE